jgi:hypothetical protein
MHDLTADPDYYSDEAGGFDHTRYGSSDGLIDPIGV